MKVKVKVVWEGGDLETSGFLRYSRPGVSKVLIGCLSPCALCSLCFTQYLCVCTKLVYLNTILGSSPAFITLLLFNSS